MRHPDRSPFNPTRVLAGAALAATAFLGSADVSAQTDYTLTKLEVNQNIQVNGTTPLTAGRSTMVRAFVRANPAPPPGEMIDGLMRIFVDGVESADSPVYSTNGPFFGGLPDPSNLNGTLNFVFVGPSSANVVITVEVNPAGPNQVVETNLANNSLATASLSFGALDVPELAYSPIDYRPSGGPTPNLPDSALIEPGVGDNFMHGIYPGKDWYYHRTDAPSKLWTNSLSGSGSSLISSLTADRLLMDPVPDFVYGWVPGALPYNGQATIGGPASMGNTQSIRHQRTFAHEIGHNTGLFHNSTIVNTYGIDVEHHLNITEGLSQLKPFTQNDIMVPGLLTPQAWIATNNYNSFINHPAWILSLTQVPEDHTPTLLVNGTYNRATGHFELHNLVEVPAHEKTEGTAGASDFTIRSHVGQGVYRELPLMATGTQDCSDSGSDSAFETDPNIAFYAVIPARGPDGSPIERLELVPHTAADAGAMEIVRSDAAPEVSFLSPTGQIDGPVVTVAWEGIDADGDDLVYYLRYSNDGEGFSPLATATSETSIEVDLRELPGLVEGEGYFEVRATDGLNTTVATSNRMTGGTQFAGVGGNDPWVEILHPDAGFTFPEGATVILHSSGWDLEDNALTGASIQWTSDLDGPIGSGRIDSVNTLSAGTHTITVTATDSNTQTTIDTAVITVTPRMLPDISNVICQTDLGSGGPGSSVLSICGDDLSSGTTADLLLSGAPAGATAYAIVGFSSNPMFLEGGVLVPTVDAIKVFVTDGSGEIFLPGVPGGGDFTAYLQFIIDDAAQVPFGYGFSNAVQVDFLP